LPFTATDKSQSSLLISISFKVVAGARNHLNLQLQKLLSAALA